MQLRKLKSKDAHYMLEWMHDEDVTKFMKADFMKMSLQDCEKFIVAAQTDRQNIHYAVCDEKDEYLGTISLKNISLHDRNAEYAIIFRKKAIGTGVAMEATKEILRIAFDELKLNRVYLDVLSDNKRAVKFYEKVGFVKEGVWRQHFFLKGKYRDVIWLSMMKGENHE